MRHPHADLIKEWAEDTSRDLEVRIDKDAPWVEAEQPPRWFLDYEYRFKPEPKPDVVRYLVVGKANGYDMKYGKTNIKVAFDGETGKLKSAEVINE